MKIALVMHNLVSKGGGPRQMLELGVTLTRLGHDVNVYAYNFNARETYSELCSQLKIKSVTQGGTLPVNGSKTPKQRTLFKFLSDAYAHVREEFFNKPRQLADLIDEPCDVINIHEWPANWAAWFLRRRYPATPIVWMCDDFWTLPKPNRNAHIWSKIAFMMVNVYCNPLRWFDWLATRNIAIIAVLSEYVARLVRPYYRRPTHVVRSGVDIAQLDALADPDARKRILSAHGLPDDSFVLLCNSIYFPHRRFEDVIDAMSALRARYPALRLIIVGANHLDPAYASLIARRIDEGRLRDIVTEVNAFLPDRELYRYYQACDAFVFPNSPQTWGLAPFEAMVYRKPVIVSDGAGAAEVLTHGTTALIYKAFDSGDLAQCIERLINDRSFCATIALNGNAYARAHHTWEGYARQMLTLYTKAQTT